MLVLKQHMTVLNVHIYLIYSVCKLPIFLVLSFDLQSPLVLFCSGQSSRTVSSSPSIESLPGGRGQSTASPPLPPSRGSDVSTSSPPLSATKKESFFNITRSRSHSKTMGKKETVSCSSCSSDVLLTVYTVLHFFTFTSTPPQWPA